MVLISGFKRRGPLNDEEERHLLRACCYVSCAEFVSRGNELIEWQDNS